jgi:hypothetical protein
LGASGAASAGLPELVTELVVLAALAALIATLLVASVRPAWYSRRLVRLGVFKSFVIIRDINSQGTTILLVEQNAQMALQVAGRGYILQTGKIILADTSAALAENEQVKKAYLGA